MANGIRFWWYIVPTLATKDDRVHSVLPMFCSDHGTAIWHRCQPSKSIAPMRCPFLDFEFHTTLNSLPCRSFTFVESFDNCVWAARLSFWKPMITSAFPDPIIDFFNNQRSECTSRTDQKDTKSCTTYPNLGFLTHFKPFCSLSNCMILCQSFFCIRFCFDFCLILDLSCWFMANGIRFWWYIVPTLATKDDRVHSVLPMFCSDHGTAIWHRCQPSKSIAPMRCPFLDFEFHTTLNSLPCRSFTFVESFDNCVWAARLSFWKPMITSAFPDPIIDFFNNQRSECTSRTDQKDTKSCTTYPNLGFLTHFKPFCSLSVRNSSNRHLFF